MDYWRLSVFAGVIIIMVVWEQLRPYRPRQFGLKRIVSNLLLTGMNTLILRLLTALAPVTAAVYVQEQHFGVMQWLAVPDWLNIVMTLFIFDFIIYFQHRIMHRIPILWRLHGLHHTDPELDFSSASRFHTIEIILSMFVKTVFVFMMGVNPLAIVIFEAVLNGMATFNHANIKLPERLEQLLRKLFVTPEMHRVHHSVVREETDSNFGFNFSIWDKCFGTYTAEAAKGDHDMVIGLNNANKIKNETFNFIWMLKAPFTFKYDDDA